MIKFKLFDSNERKLTRIALKWLKQDSRGKEYLKLFKLTASFNYEIIKDFSNKETDDQLTIKYLGSRIFNFGIMSYRAAISGYYQVSISLMREFVEGHFLLDYFRSNRSEISRWKNSNDKTRKKDFSPHQLYTKLDNRDQFTGEERKQQYQLFCENAAHASYKGFKLLTNSTNQVETGYFFNEKKLLNSMVELSKRYGAVTLALIPILNMGGLIAIDSEIKLLRQFQKLFGSSITLKSNRNLICLLMKQKRILKKVLVTS